MVLEFIVLEVVNMCIKLAKCIKVELLIKDPTNTIDLHMMKTPRFYMEMVVLLLLLEKVLTSKYGSKEDKQRIRIFHYTCTVKDKVCSLIINIGRFEKVISA